MASYPGAKKRYAGNRRRLGRGQGNNQAAVILTVTAHSADVAYIVSPVPVVWKTPIVFTVATLSIVSQVVVDQFTLAITMSGAVSGHGYVVGANAGMTYTGGTTAPAVGTF